MPGVTTGNIASTDEEWRPVPDWPDYSVSSAGRVISHKGKRPRLLVQWDQNGYPFVTLRVPGRRKTATVHGLVARAFLGPRPEGLEVRHLNGEAWDCRLQNLSYGTHAENMQDCLAHGRHAMANKTHCPREHPYSPENTVSQQGGRRVCRICKNARQRDYRVRQSFRAAGISAAA